MNIDYARNFSDVPIHVSDVTVHFSVVTHSNTLETQ